MNVHVAHTGCETATFVIDLSEHYLICPPKVRQMASIWLNGDSVAYDIALKYHNISNEQGIAFADNLLAQNLKEILAGDVNKIGYVSNYIYSIVKLMRHHLEPMVNNCGIYMKDVQVAYIEEQETDEWTTGSLLIRLNYPTRHQVGFTGASYGVGGAHIRSNPILPV